ncbi:BREX-1 system adenine-specific DNA-methyltransferase PglX [Clostridium niameyense]|uniref:site-specific DNA-methyltransferase (adenine-specific) n=1 Tax=Clostridium niameyense TaxID=1622073 RepID=A0A6M0RAN3_9CLOT|nr:BREX-1 system adenine-specific DNA-methyltransferase PglX [Clostridium niameyense]NEZ47325.1 BREX-1 system adenine-specific DNA-methyltransferase PglX [Clostridium niameyense]
MDKGKIKSFAMKARKNLIKAVTDKANEIGIKIDYSAHELQIKETEDISNIYINRRESLINKIKEYSKEKGLIYGFEQVVEEVAYTWFSRFIALRYMEVNDYLPLGIRILSSQIENKLEPDILTRVSEVIDELELNAEYIYKLSDNNNTQNREKAYKQILIKQCNKLEYIMPQVFKEITDYTELLCPDNLLQEGSIIRTMVEEIEENNWIGNVEIIGWLYQYYISEKKDEVFSALKKNIKITKENIPAATQLFTPKWIVKYMVENSLGKLWLEGHPNKELQSEWKYYLEDKKQVEEVEEELKEIRKEHSKLNPENIKVLDPCMGSGHILVYAFDVLYKIYKTVGYKEREIPRLILKNNLYGLDIDDIAEQLASFALIMKARYYNRNLFREMEKEKIELNLCSIQESNEISKEVLNYFVGEDDKLREDIGYLVNVFKDAKEYGSMLEVKEVNFNNIEQRVIKIFNDKNSVEIDNSIYKYKSVILEKLIPIIKQGKIMSQKYEVCCTNPPYMGIRGMNKKMALYLEKNYVLSKYDLFSVYMEVCKNRLKSNGLYSIINQHSWMFLSSFLNFRLELLDKLTFLQLVHLGSRAFEENVGTIVQSVMFVCRNKRSPKYATYCIDLTKAQDSKSKNELFLALDKSKVCNYKDINLNKLLVIPTKPFAYWVSKNILNICKSNNRFEDFAKPRQGMATSDNKRFLKKWYEVNINNISFTSDSAKSALLTNKKWFPYNKGGTSRKWYGNNEFIINWFNDGEEVKAYASKLYKSYSRTIKNEQFYFNECITYTFISENMGARYSPKGFIFDVAGSSIFLNSENIKVILGLLCSKVSSLFLDIMNPTYNIQVGDIKNIPICKEIFAAENTTKIEKLVVDNIYISKQDWDFFETSCNFKCHPLLTFRGNSLEDSFNNWSEFTRKQFNRLKANEEELNAIFINIYGVENELNPKVYDKDITIRKANRKIDIKSFISYAVGCMFGRYSMDVEGLIYAGGQWNHKFRVLKDKNLNLSSLRYEVRKIKEDENRNILEDNWINVSFIPDEDNIIPITDDEYFEEDIVSRFIEFVKIVYGEETLEKNLDFISDSIGRKSSQTSRQAIRMYFLKDFYKDHLKTYEKRPIYWLFDSGKNNGFKSLIYVHRYDDQIVTKVREKYLHILQRKYEREIHKLQLVLTSKEYTSKDKTLAKKKISKIVKQMEECRKYDEVATYLANKKIVIDLDDGVRANYDKFQGIEFISSKGKKIKMNLLGKI